MLTYRDSVTWTERLIRKNKASMGGSHWGLLPPSQQSFLVHLSLWHYTRFLVYGTQQKNFWTAKVTISSSPPSGPLQEQTGEEEQTSCLFTGYEEILIKGDKTLSWQLTGIDWKLHLNEDYVTCRSGLTQGILKLRVSDIHTGILWNCCRILISLPKNYTDTLNALQ